MGPGFLRWPSWWAGWWNLIDDTWDPD